MADADRCASGNLHETLPEATATEVFEALLARPGVRIERIVSHGQATPPGEWYDQAWDEWVLLVAGDAGLLLEDEPAPRHLRPGDYLLLPGHCRHRVEWTAPDRTTIWLAVHLGEAGTLEPKEIVHELWRQDDNGNRFLVGRYEDRAAAEQRLAELTRQLHKQTYWITESNGLGGSDGNN